MAKKEQETEAIATQFGGSMAIPDFLKTEGREGLENVSREDIAIPRIALAQGLSPELDSSKSNYIENLRLGEMFNNITGEIYGKGPLNFTIIQANKPRWVEFYPRSEGGGVKDPNVEPGDPRTQFGDNGELPIATKFYDFLIALLPLRENSMDSIVALSFKSAMLKTARQLNMLMVSRNKPPYSGVYSLKSIMTANSKGSFAIYKIDNAGWITDPALYNALKDLYESFIHMNIDIKREANTGDDVSFDPAKMESSGM